MSRAQVSAADAAGTATPVPTAAAQLRAEFWSLPADALLDRSTTAAGTYRSVKALEEMATKGGGPRYIRLGRKALYRKSDVLQWIEANSQTIENTAQLASPRVSA